MCPECGADWFAGVRQEDGVRCSRLIGVSSRELDRVVEWVCPDCGYRWDRGDPALTSAGDT